ncbi:Dihydroorotase [Rickettsiales bacterium Ac37b]|nr:Dihydroorotase [Rickettsiales bacterium Ac37b]
MQQQWQLPLRTNQHKKIAYINARLYDPSTGLDAQGALLTIGDQIADFGKDLFRDNIPDGIEVIDCKGHLLAPGLIDMQVHFREPGQTHKETLATGSKSAVSGGITTVVCQPNTEPAIDSVEVVELLKAKAKDTAYLNILAYAAITKKRNGQELTEMGKLVEAGVVGFTDDGGPVMNPLLMRRALSYSSMFGVPIAQHAEDLHLSQGGCINEGEVSFKLGVTGIPNISESVMVERDLAILGITGGKYHVLHISTKEALKAVKRAKEEGLKVTCEVAPHHFLLTDKAVLEHGSYAKMNPPLRSEEDRLALIQGLQEGIIDAIATDHAPHDEESKQVSLASASFGIVGVETMLPLSLELYHNGLLSLQDVLSKMTSKPAEILGLQSGRLLKGNKADLVLIDLNREWVIETEKFSSKSKNSPFNGRKVKGRAIKTIVGGEIVYSLIY